MQWMEYQGHCQQDQDGPVQIDKAAGQGVQDVQEVCQADLQGLSHGKIKGPSQKTAHKCYFKGQKSQEV
jgi:hypothetical protein